MTTPVSAGRRTTIETLGAQHRTVLARLNELDGGGGPEAARMEALLALLAGELEEHLELEEQALFPVLARHAQLTARPVGVMQAEHGELRALAGELARALRAGSPGRAEGVGRVIAALLRAHIDKEDHVLFPLAERMLTLAELEEVEARAAAAAQISPPPHPSTNMDAAAPSALTRAAVDAAWPDNSADRLIPSPCPSPCGRGDPGEPRAASQGSLSRGERDR